MLPEWRSALCFGQVLHGLWGISPPASADQDLCDQDRNADHDGTSKIDHYKCPTTVFTSDVRESPDIA